MKRIAITAISVMCVFALSAKANVAEPITYQNVFMSYYTPNNVATLVDYAKQIQLGGIIMWELKGDAAYDSSASLLKSAVNTFKPEAANPPMIMSYWTDWSVYSNDASSRAIPEPAYAVPGSTDIQGQPVKNADFSQKLAGVNVMAYAFVEAQTSQYTYWDSKTQQMVTKSNPDYNQNGGTLYFNDPWSDLLPTEQDSFCSADNPICWYAVNMQDKKPETSGKMGNFEAFAKLTRPDNDLGSLKKLISVGGYGHDDTFEESFNNQDHISNFINSAAKIINQYNLDGIDLDYENPNMSFQQSNDFLALIKALREKLGSGKLITVTILSNPEYIQGTQGGDQGFDPGTGVLANIANYADKINLMTYDFHGAFDYAPGQGRTGFLTNLYMPTDTPAGYDARFSVDTSVAALMKMGVAARKINAGIPAYSRALAGIPNDNNGLFQIIPNAASIPRGDLDSASCSTGISPMGPNSCSGSFQYKYIIENMLGKGFTEKEWNDSSSKVSNGTTAYASSWTVPVTAGYSLELKNEGDLGIIIGIHSEDEQATFGPSDYIGPGSAKSYTEMTVPSTEKINNQSNLTVHWETYAGGPQGDCADKLNLTSNMQVSVSVDNQGVGSCSIKPAGN